MKGAKRTSFGHKAIETMLQVKDYVKIFYYADDMSPIDKATALAFAPEHITATGTIFIAYVYVYENNKHVTGVFTNLNLATQTMLEARDRMQLTKRLDEFIY